MTTATHPVPYSEQCDVQGCTRSWGHGHFGLYCEPCSQLPGYAGPAPEPVGAHRRSDAATDQALCQYRDDAEALFGTYYHGTHQGPVDVGGHQLRQLAAAQAAGKPGMLQLSRQLNSRRTDTELAWEAIDQLLDGRS